MQQKWWHYVSNKFELFHYNISFFYKYIDTSIQIYWWKLHRGLFFLFRLKKHIKGLQLYIIPSLFRWDNLENLYLIAAEWILITACYSKMFANWNIFKLLHLHVFFVRVFIYIHIQSQVSANVYRITFLGRQKTGDVSDITN